MGIKDWFKPKYTDEDIVSVVILETTQLYKTKTNWGTTFGPGPDKVIAMGDSQIPDGSITTFSVTYKDGVQQIVKARSGTDKCDRLLQLAMDPPKQAPEEESMTYNSDGRKYKYTPVEVKKNQLPQGKYVAGKDIPVGTFDFTWVWGRGTLIVYKNEKNSEHFGDWELYTNMGDDEYSYRQCLNAHLENGYVLILSGNILVQISRSKEIEIDL